MTNRDHPSYMGAALVGLIVGALTFMACGLLISALTPPAPTTVWVKLTPPLKDSYTSWVPCVRTSGWLLPVVECYPAESRSELMRLDEPACRVPDPVACRVAR